MPRVVDLPTYRIAEAVPLNREEYVDFALHSILHARERIWLMSFIMEIRPQLDTALVVRRLINQLSYAAWKGVDTRVLIGGGRTPDLQVATLTAARYLRALGIHVRIARPRLRTRNLHSKYLIMDHDVVVVGSQNWSPGGLGVNIEDAIAIRSQQLNAHLAGTFMRSWTQCAEISE